MSRFWLCLTFGLMAALALQWIVIAGVTLLSGGELVFRDFTATLVIELVVAAFALILAFVMAVKVVRRCR